MNLKDLNLQGGNMQLQDLKTKTASTDALRDVRSFDQRMNLQNLKSLDIQKTTPEVKLLEVKQITTPQFRIPQINNNTTDLSVSINTDQNITQKQNDLMSNVPALKNYSFDMNTKNINFKAPNLSTPDISQSLNTTYKIS